MNPIVSLGQFALIAAVTLAVVGYASWKGAGGAGRPLRLAMAVSRSLAAAGVLALLLNVGRWRETVEIAPSHWVVLVDRSASMSTRDAGKDANRSRWEEAIDVIAEARRVSDRPDAGRFYAFGEKLEPVDPDRITASPDAGDTRTITAGQDLLSREAGKGASLRGILLLSDGRQPQRAPAEPFALRAAARGAPIFALPLGGDVVKRDLALETGQRRYVSFLGQPVTLNASVRNEAMGPIEAHVRLQDPLGQTAGEMRALTTNGQVARVQFDVNPKKAGYSEFTMELASPEGDSDRSNNRLTAGVFVLTQKLRILLLEGEPYWDTKFLSHLLRVQTNMVMDAVFRVANDRFFKVSGEAGLVAAGAETFPATDEEMGRYDLVVLGRGSEYLIDAERARRLEFFVRDRGGCVFFGRGKSYSGSDSFLKDLEPLEWGAHAGTEFVLRPLLAGEQAGLFGGLLPGRDSPLWRSLPPLERAFRCESLKSFGSVLAEGAAPGGGVAFPALVSRRLGRGLVVLVNGDGLWRWGFFPQVTEEHDLYRNLWLRLFQWAVTATEFNPGADFAIHADPGTVRLGDAVRVRVVARSNVGDERPSVQVYRGAEHLQAIAMAADREPHQWSGMLTPGGPGSYRLVVETSSKRDTAIQTTVLVLPQAGETDQVAADAEFLRELAELSGGRVLRREEITPLIRDLSSPVRIESEGEIEWDPEWDRGWFALLVCGCLSLEWYWRRRQGLL